MGERLLEMEAILKTIYSRKLTEHCKPAVMEKKSLYIKKPSTTTLYFMGEETQDQIAEGTYPGF